MLLAYFLLVSLQAPSVSSQATLVVQWTAPAECPDRAALLAAISRRLGRPFADEAEVVATVTGDRFRGYALHLELTAGGRAEVRDVQDPSCMALTDAAAVRVVAAIEAPVVPAPPQLPPETEPTQVAPEPAPEPVPEPEPEPAVVPGSAPQPQPVQTDRYDGPGGVLRLHGGGELGALATPGGPRPTGAVGLALGLMWPRLRVELHGTVLTPRNVGSVNAGLYAGAVHACGRVGRGVLEIPLCGGLEVGAMRGKADPRLPSARTVTGVWVAVIVGPALAWHASPRISVWAGLQLVVAPLSPVFEQGDNDPPVVLFQPSIASGRLLLGVELRLRDRW